MNKTIFNFPLRYPRTLLALTLLANAGLVNVTMNDQLVGISKRCDWFVSR